MMKKENPYQPYPVRIDDIIVETVDRSLKTFKFTFVNKEDEEAFSFIPGQFAEISVPGQGEIPIGIASSPTEKGFLYFTIQKVGKVTQFLHNMKIGDIVGLRGPLGNAYPWDYMKGKNVVVIGGGCAFSTLRSSIVWMLDPANRADFGNIEVVYGARSTGHLLYMEDIVEWRRSAGINMNVTVDSFGDGEVSPEWGCSSGFVPAIVEEKVTPEVAKNSVVIVCGPPVMIRFTKPVLQKVGFKDEDIILSLENRMKCGLGMCGRCNVGDKLVCKDGPVFSLAELGGLPDDF